MGAIIISALLWEKISKNQGQTEIVGGMSSFCGDNLVQRLKDIWCKSGWDKEKSLGFVSIEGFACESE